MNKYDSETNSDPNEWLALNEDERISLVEDYHRDLRISLPKSMRHVHAVMHVIVENQLAMNEDPVVRALARLKTEGLSRHDAVHAIGSVLSEPIYDLLQEKDSAYVAQARYDAWFERITQAECQKN